MATPSTQAIMAGQAPRYTHISPRELDEMLKPSNSYERRHMARFPTTQESQAFQFEVAEVAKKRSRMETHQFGSDLISGTTDPLMYAKKLFRKHLEGLMARNISTYNFHFKNFEWAVPGVSSSPQQLDTWEMVQRCPMLVSDTELQTIFKMEESTIHSPPTPDGVRILYIRTYPISPANLQLFLSRMIARGISYEEFGAWDSILAVYRNPAAQAPARLYLRYAGETEGPKRAIDRQVEDEQRNYGVMATFTGAISEFLPQVAQESKVWTLRDGCLPPVEDSYSSIEDNGRMAIQVLHPPTLLNRQAGGFYANYAPTSEDAANFRNLETDFWNHFNSNATIPDAGLRSQLAYHFGSVQKYANENPAEAGTSVVAQYSDQWTDITRTQATPYMYKKFTILVFIGKDVTREEYIAMGTFLADPGKISAKSRAGNITRSTIYRLVRKESINNRNEFPPGSFDLDYSPWCFVDLWSWLWHKNPQKALEFLQEYMLAVQPIVAGVYSKPVNGITRANFLHGNGVALNQLINIVGIPTIQFVLPSGGPEQEETAYINVPHIHPGKDKYGEQDSRLRRVLDLTMQLMFLLGQLALRYIDQLEREGQQPPSRYAICKRILIEYQNLCENDDAYKTFYSALTSARNELIKYWNEPASNGQSSVDVFFDERPGLTPEGYQKIQDLGRAEHPAGSIGRANQLEEIWEQNMPDLHLKYDHELIHKKKWTKLLLAVEEGQYFYLAVLASATPNAYSRNLFETFRTGRTKGKLNNDWFDSKEGRARAVRDASDFVTQELQNLATSGEIVSNLSGQSSTKAFLSPKDCHKRRVVVSVIGMIYIHFVHPDGRHIRMETRCKSAIPQTSSLRYMHFTEHGIDILGARGEVYKREMLLTATQASITLSHIQKDVDYVTLWRLGCEAHGISTDALPKSGAATKAWGPAGVAPYNSQAKSDKPVQPRSPKPTDGNWLLKTFIESQDPLKDGGVFRTATVDHFADSTEDLQNFVKFLKQPEYCGHPHYSAWTKYLDGETPSAPGVLGKNLPILRHSIVTYQSRATSKRTNASDARAKYTTVSERYYTIGPPGSALDDPWKVSGNQSCLAEKDRKANEKILKAGGKLGSDDGSEDDDDDNDDKPAKGESSVKPSSSKDSSKKSGSKAVPEDSSKKSGGKAKDSAKKKPDAKDKKGPTKPPADADDDLNLPALSPDDDEEIEEITPINKTRSRPAAPKRQMPAPLVPARAAAAAADDEDEGPVVKKPKRSKARRVVVVDDEDDQPTTKETQPQTGMRAWTDADIKRKREDDEATAPEPSSKRRKSGSRKSGSSQVAEPKTPGSQASQSLEGPGSSLMGSGQSVYQPPTDRKIAKMKPSKK